MTENEWTQSVCDKLRESLAEHSLFAETLKKIPYSQEIIGYSENWIPQYMEPTRFETDLLIYEKNGERIIPRIIVEAKFGNITTHDAITYSYKAEKHKNITPYLRYGIMIGSRKDFPLPGRLFRHGSNFDFMISFKDIEPEGVEWSTFTEMLLREVEYLRAIEEMLHESRKGDRKRYFMMQKQLVLRGFDE